MSQKFSFDFHDDAKGNQLFFDEKADKLGIYYSQVGYPSLIKIFVKNGDQKFKSDAYMRIQWPENATEEENMKEKYHIQLIDDFVMILRSDGYALRVKCEEGAKEIEGK